MRHTTLFTSSLLLFTFLTGCDYVDRRVTDGERADKLYRAAMEEYAAGHLEKSAEIFAKVLKTNPGNASARFQLACLLQDHGKDPLGAICNYREYKALFPNGDKVRMADERMAICERQLATMLVKKYKLGGSVAQDETIARLGGDKTKLTSELDETKRELDKLKNELASVRRENERVRRMVVAGVTDDADRVTESPEKPNDEVATTSAKKMPELPDEKELLEDDATGVDRVKLSADVANLIAEEKEETSESAPFGQTARKSEEPKAAPKEPPHEPRPHYYVVQEGDTLFKLAVRFYGRRSAWSAIRDANKESVSLDGRIKAGQKLRMP